MAGDFLKATHKDYTREHQQLAKGNSCPYFQVAPNVPGEVARAGDDSKLSYRCSASEVPFRPSLVHQSSCCLNPANFVRCPYYVEVMGEEKRQVDFQFRKRSIVIRVRDQLIRLLSFGRLPRKKRRRIHVVI